MAEPWITPADLDDAYGEGEVSDLADIDRDGARDPGVVEKAIRSAEGRVRSRLLTRYRPDELPASAAQVPEPLRRVTVDLAFYELHKRYEQVPDSVVRIRKDAEDELADLVRGLGSLDLAARPPADATRSLIVTTPSREDRLTLKTFET